MTIAALVTWLITALGGFFMLGTWIARGGVRGGTSRLPVPVLLGHVLLAAAGLVVWIIYLLADTKALAWTALALLVPVALLGFVMFFRWLAVTRTPSVHTAAAPGSAQAATAPEAAFPIPIVLGHGLLAVATLILVLLSALS
jgi:hypothetical protein